MRIVLEVNDTDALRPDESFIVWLLEMSEPAMEELLWKMDPDDHHYSVVVIGEDDEPTD